MKQKTRTTAYFEARKTLSDALERANGRAYYFYKLFYYYGLDSWFDAISEWDRYVKGNN